MPQITGTIVVVWTTITIVVLKVFDIVFAMTNGQWETQVLANYMYDKMFRANDWGMGSAAAMIINADGSRRSSSGTSTTRARKCGDGCATPTATGRGGEPQWITIAGKKSSLTWAVHISVLALVSCSGSFPTLGLLILVIPHDRADPHLGLVGRALSRPDKRGLPRGRSGRKPVFEPRRALRWSEGEFIFVDDAPRVQRRNCRKSAIIVPGARRRAISRQSGRRDGRRWARAKR